MGAQWVKPVVAARQLGMPSSTLRLYSARFAPLLSTSAGGSDSGDDRPSTRFYCSTDIATLTKAKKLISLGATYREALKELRVTAPETIHCSTPVNCPNFPGLRPQSGTEVAKQSDALDIVLKAAFAPYYERLAEVWRRIAEERAEENSRQWVHIRGLEAELGKSRWRGIARVIGLLHHRLRCSLPGSN